MTDAAKESFDPVIDREHRRLNYDICKAIDVGAAGTAINSLMASGRITRAHGDALNALVSSTRHVLLEALHVAFGEGPDSK